MVLKLLEVNGIEKAEFLFIHSVQTLIMVLQKPRQPMELLVLRYGSLKVKYCPRRIVMLKAVNE